MKKLLSFLLLTGSLCILWLTGCNSPTLNVPLDGQYVTYNEILADDEMLSQTILTHQGTNRSEEWTASSGEILEQGANFSFKKFQGHSTIFYLLAETEGGAWFDYTSDIRGECWLIACLSDGSVQRIHNFEQNDSGTIAIHLTRGTAFVALVSTGSSGNVFLSLNKLDEGIHLDNGVYGFDDALMEEFDIQRG